MMSQPQSHKSRSGQTQSMIITAITLFALSGLMVGFAVGAFVRPKGNGSTSSTPGPQHTTIATQAVSPSPSPSSTNQVVPLGCPVVQTNASEAKADDATSYNATVQAKDKTGYDQCKNIAQEQPITADGITCKIWLTSSQSPNDDIKTDTLKDVRQLTNPFPNEVVDGLKFDTATPQVQPCKRGLGTWNFKIANTVPSGKYNLVGLTDWNGTYFNWSWQAVTVNNSAIPATVTPTATAKPN